MSSLDKARDIQAKRISFQSMNFQVEILNLENFQQKFYIRNAQIPNLA